MTLVDVHCLIGGYPFRHVPHPEPEILRRVLEREGVAEAWVGHLPSAWWRDPAHGNAELYDALAQHAPVLRPVPTVRPDWPHWRDHLDGARRHDAPAVRAYPSQWGFGAEHPAMRELAEACGAAGLILILTTRFEDARQRHWMDGAADLSAAAVRWIARDGAAEVIVAAPSRALVEEVHWGLTPDERARVTWEISWLWGPPEDDLAHLLRTIGAERFVYGTGWPLRLTQLPRANLELLPPELANVALAGGAAISARARSAAERASRAR